MFRTGLHRRLIALVAAYALALQALLAGGIAPSPSAMATSVICAGARSGDPQRESPVAPHRGVDCTLCMLVCAGGAAPPASAPTVAPIARRGSAIRPPHFAGSIAPSLVHAARARGPPA